MSVFSSYFWRSMQMLSQYSNTTQALFSPNDRCLLCYWTQFIQSIYWSTQWDTKGGSCVTLSVTATHNTPLSCWHPSIASEAGCLFTRSNNRQLYLVDERCKCNSFFSFRDRLTFSDNHHIAFSINCMAFSSLSASVNTRRKKGGQRVMFVFFFSWSRTWGIIFRW